MRGQNRSIQVLFVCTGNIFRSPMAQGYLQAAADCRDLALVASSAGTLRGDRPISPRALEVMGADGLTMAGHRSRALVAEELRRVDLVLGMAREHVREAVIAEPSVWPKAFTLKELVRRAGSVGPRRIDEPFDKWLDRVAGGRSRQDMLGYSEDDDVVDPYDSPAAVLQAVSDEIRQLVDQLLEVMGT